MSEYIFKLPDLGEGTIEAEIAEWMVKVGDVVKEEDPICAMLTDKAAVELTAPVSGKVVAVAGEEGDMVAVGSALIVFASEGGLPGAKAARGEMEQTRTVVEAEALSAVTEISQGSAKVITSPSIRNRAKEAGINLNQIQGSGPRGRILKADFESFLSRRETGGPAPATVAQPLTGTTQIKVVGLRRMIAQRMAQSSQEIPHFTYVEEIDVTALESLRRHLNSKKTADQPKLTPLAFIALALARVLKDFPQCNAHYDKERNVIVRHQGIHLGIATQTSDGLKVPVVRHCEARTLEDLAGEIRRVSTAARDKTAKREELTGSTITITSLGRIGGVVTTPLINQPEVAIIGVNKAIERPVAINGQVVVRTMMNLSSCFDHRFVDGFDAAQMIQALKDLLEQPATIFMP
ncbi:MAG: 2-oxo acid dehydrogenase subunit E2 [Proteobacteria bacterium]|nr:2-oxo acid dehydrogenase subunit E2 [Pseudomonadota bacterium]